MTRNTGHLDPHARTNPTLTAIKGLLWLLLLAGLAAYGAARAGIL